MFTAKHQLVFERRTMQGVGAIVVARLPCVRMSTCLLQNSGFLGTALPLIIVVHTFIRCFGNCVVSKPLPLSTRMRECSGKRGLRSTERRGS